VLRSIIYQREPFITIDTSITEGYYLVVLAGSYCYSDFEVVFSIYICFLPRYMLFRSFFPILLGSPLATYQWTPHSFIPYC
jgi:hypothetical protein